jgi:hypothetical protein
MYSSVSFPGEWKIDVVVQDYPMEAPTTRFAVVNFTRDGSTHCLHLPAMGAEQAKVLRSLAQHLLRAADELEQARAPAPQIPADELMPGNPFTPASNPVYDAVGIFAPAGSVAPDGQPWTPPPAIAQRYAADRAGELAAPGDVIDVEVRDHDIPF